MPAARKTRRLIVLAALLSVGAVAFAVWPRGPRLEWYTSLPIKQGGSAVRFRTLLPQGWIPAHRTYFAEFVPAGVFGLYLSTMSLGRQTEFGANLRMGRTRALHRKEVEGIAVGVKPNQSDPPVYFVERTLKMHGSESY